MTKKLRNSIKKTPAINKDLPGYPLYAASDDIYQQNKEEQDIDPENVNKKKSANEKSNTKNEKSFKEDPTGGDLDVPGSELPIKIKPTQVKNSSWLVEVRGFEPPASTSLT